MANFSHFSTVSNMLIFKTIFVIQDTINNLKHLNIKHLQKTPKNLLLSDKRFGISIA
jgi:hypothetical protein